MWFGIRGCRHGCKKVWSGTNSMWVWGQHKGIWFRPDVDGGFSQSTRRPMQEGQYHGNLNGTVGKCHVHKEQVHHTHNTGIILVQVPSVPHLLNTSLSSSGVECKAGLAHGRPHPPVPHMQVPCLIYFLIGLLDQPTHTPGKGRSCDPTL